MRMYSAGIVQSASSSKSQKPRSLCAPVSALRAAAMARSRAEPRTSRPPSLEGCSGVGA